MRSLKRVALALLLLSTHSTPAFAEEPTSSPTDARARAMRTYDEGSAAFAAKRYKDAIDLFLEADRLVSSAALAFNISLAYEAMGDVSSTLRWSREYLRRAPDADDRHEVAGKVSHMEQNLRDKGVQQLMVLSTPRGATVLVDGDPRGVTPWAGDLPPGLHDIELRLANHSVARREITLTPDRALDLSVDLERETPVPAPPRHPNEGGPKPSMEAAGVAAFGPLPIAGLSLAGAGVAAFGASVGLEVARAGREADARAAMRQVDAMSHLEAMEDLQLGARVAAGVGAGLLATGGTLLVVGLVTDRPIDESSPKVSASCSGEGCYFSMKSAF